MAKKKPANEPKPRLTMAILESRLAAVEAVVVQKQDSPQWKWVAIAALFFSVCAFVPNVVSIGRWFKSDGGQEQVTPIDDKPKSLTGVIVLVHNRLPLSSEDQSIVDAALEYEKAHPELDFASIDVADKDEKVVNIISKAKAAGIDPPLVMHKATDGKVRFSKWPKDGWSGIVKEFAR